MIECKDQQQLPTLEGLKNSGRVGVVSLGRKDRPPTTSADVSSKTICVKRTTCMALCELRKDHVYDITERVAPNKLRQDHMHDICMASISQHEWVRQRRLQQGMGSFLETPS
eukprot:scaffold272301_cov18-Tisochrysis_lutea.AAC.1